MKKNLSYYGLFKPNSNWHKFILTMKFSAFLLFCCIVDIIAAPTYSQVTKISLNLKDATIEEVLNKIEDVSEFYFLYNNKLIDVTRKVNIEADKEPIKDILNDILNKNTKFVVYDRQIILTPSDVTSLSAVLQQLKITGTVTDEKGSPLPGATVQVKGSTLGTLTDATGKYILDNVPQNATLTFSFIGMATQEIPLEGRNLIDVVLKEETIGLEEVVVIGYGRQAKTSVTASVAAIEGEQLSGIPVTDLSSGLGGRLTGVIAKQISGEPGRDGSRINIRGISTIGNANPLIIVDGIPRSFQQLDQNDIESITVLKDAAAVAPYGVAGANGVILITTKSGQSGEFTVTYNGYMGWQAPTVLPDQVDSYHYALLKNMAAKNVGSPTPYSDDVLQKLKDGSDPDRYPSYEIYDEIITKHSPLTKHAIQISGGSEKLIYYANIGYMYQDGMWVDHLTTANQYNLAMAVESKITSTTDVKLKINGSVKDVKRPVSDQYWNNTSRLIELLGYANFTYGPMWYSNGMPGNHLVGALYTGGYNKSNDHRFFLNLSVDQEIPFISGLTLSGTIAYDPTYYYDKYWSTPVHVAQIDLTKDPYEIYDAIFYPPTARLNERWDRYQQLTYQAKLDYNKQFGEHNIGLLGVVEAKTNTSASLLAFRKDYDVPVDVIDMGSPASDDMQTGGGTGEAKQMGLVYRLTYDYSKKYLLELSGRYDGHYYFSTDKRFGFFPAASVGWVVTEENFLKNKISWLDLLKLRASYGEVGALAGGPFQYMLLYNISGPGYSFGGSGVSVATPQTEPNVDITWERSRKSNVGIELIANQGKIKFEADYFYEKRSNMLVSPNIITPLEYGIGLSQVNAGVMRNQGVELLGEVNYPVSHDLHLALTGTFTFARNKLLKVFETEATYNSSNRRRTGRPLGTPFGYKSIGYFQEDDFNPDGTLKEGIPTQPWGKVYPGDIRYEDINKDGKISELDEVAMGYPEIPEIMYSFSPKVIYKDLTLDLFFQGASHMNATQRGEAVWAFYNGMSAYMDHFDSWTPDNPDARHPRLTPSPVANNMVRSTHWLADKSYLRLKNVTLSYILPPSIISPNDIKHITVFLSGQNLFTWTKAINWDPEVANELARTYMMQKTIAVGVNLTF